MKIVKFHPIVFVLFALSGLTVILVSQNKTLVAQFGIFVLLLVNLYINLYREKEESKDYKLMLASILAGMLVGIMM